MSAIMYTSAKEAFCTGLDWSAVNIKAVFVDAADYTRLATDDFLSDIPAGARIATSGNMTSKTNVAGLLDCADFTFSAVTGDEGEQIAFYVDTGSAATSQLLFNYDGYTITPSGGDINVTVNASGLAQLMG